MVAGVGAEEEDVGEGGVGEGLRRRYFLRFCQ